MGSPSAAAGGAGAGGEPIGTSCAAGEDIRAAAGGSRGAMEMAAVDVRLVFGAGVRRRRRDLEITKHQAEDPTDLTSPQAPPGSRPPQQAALFDQADSLPLEFYPSMISDVFFDSQD